MNVLLTRVSRLEAGGKETVKSVEAQCSLCWAKLKLDPAVPKRCKCGRRFALLRGKVTVSNAN